MFTKILSIRDFCPRCMHAEVYNVTEVQVSCIGILVLSDLQVGSVLFPQLMTNHVYTFY